MHASSRRRSAQTFHPAARSRTHSSGSSPAIRAGSKPPTAAERRDAHQGVAPAGPGLADGRVPLDVGQPVVDRARPGAARAAARRRRPRRAGPPGASRAATEPAGDDLAVAVDELDEGRRRGRTSSSRSKPSLRARAAVNGTERSSSTTSTPATRAARRCRRSSRSRRRRPPRPAADGEARQARSRSPSLRPIATTPMSGRRSIWPALAARPGPPGPFAITRGAPGPPGPRDAEEGTTPPKSSRAAGAAAGRLLRLLEQPAQHANSRPTRARARGIIRKPAQSWAICRPSRGRTPRSSRPWPRSGSRCTPGRSARG